MNGRGGKTSSHSSFLLSQYSGVLIDRIDLASRTDQIGQCQCEGPGSRAEIGPYSSCLQYTLAQQIYVIFVDHRISFSSGQNTFVKSTIKIQYKDRQDELPITHFQEVYGCSTMNASSSSAARD